MAGRFKTQEAQRAVVLYNMEREKCRKRHTRILKMLEYFTRRRRVLLNSMLPLQLISASLLSISQERPRKLRGARQVHQSGWWKMAWEQFTEERFKKTFRLGRETFSWLILQIGDAVKKEDTGQGCIEPDERLAMCLYRLTRGDYLY